VAEVVYAAAAVADLERLEDATAGTQRLILSAVVVLTAHPLIGGAVERGLRELVISRGHTGYVALYDFHDVADLVVIHCIRHQREAGANDQSP